MTSPSTKKEDVIEVMHGTEITDSYRWLEGVKEKEVKDWLDLQSNHTDSVLGGLPFRDELRKEFTELAREDVINIPFSRNGFYFFTRRNADEDLFVLCVKNGIDGAVRILVDPNSISTERGSVVNLAGFSISNDGSLITYLLSENSNDQSHLYVMNVSTGENIEALTNGNLYPSTGTWDGNSGFWYTRREDEVPPGEEKFHKRVFYHKLESSFSDDRIIFGKELPKEDYPRAIVSGDQKHLQISVHISSESRRRTEVYVKNIEEEGGVFRSVVKDLKGSGDTLFSAVIYKDYAYILHNYNAPNGRVDRVALDNLGKSTESWELIVPEDEVVVIEDIKVTSDRIFILTLKNVKSELKVHSLSGEILKEIQFPGIGTSSGVLSEHDGKEGFFRFSSFTDPLIIFRIDFETNTTSVYERTAAHADAKDIVSTQIRYKSKDGTDVPMFLVHDKDFKPAGDAPIVLYGYGGFSVSMRPAFRKHIVPFLKRGGVYAIASLRGGGEFGEKWHRAGTKENKQNVFDDFISAAEWLIKEKYTNSNKLAISGGSNGGLLVGAVSNQRPELFKAVIMAVPVADMLRYHLFHGGRHWIADYGCADDPEMFQYLLNYSPYHNVKSDIKYPSVLIETSEEDDRVHTGQAFKMAAKLQEIETEERPVLLRVEKNAGHGGSADVSRSIEAWVDEWSFLFWQLGVKSLE